MVQAVSPLWLMFGSRCKKYRAMTGSLRRMLVTLRLSLLLLAVITPSLHGQPPEDKLQPCGVTRSVLQRGNDIPPDSRNMQLMHLPVVVHIVWNDENQNLTDRQVRAQIDALNADFRLQNARSRFLPEPFAALAADARLEFCLASTDPSGNPSTGITRTKTMLTKIGDARAQDGRRVLFYSELGGQSAWDPHRYINVYVCDLSFLGLVPAAMDTAVLLTPEDGIIINTHAFSTTSGNPPYHLGTTLTHEMGHYLGLAHPWGNDPDNCLEDDGIDDTPIQGTTYLGTCPASPQESCGSSDMYMNFMNFTDDDCLAAFTTGQVAAMHAFLMSRRSALTETTLGCHDQGRPFDLSDQRVSVFPNPTSSFLNVEIDVEPEQRIHWRLVDALGRTLKRGERTAGEYRPLSVVELSAGWHVLYLESVSGSISIPFLKL